MVKTIICYLVPNLSYKGGGVTVSAQCGLTIQSLSKEISGVMTVTII